MLLLHALTSDSRLLRPHLDGFPGLTVFGCEEGKE